MSAIKNLKVISAASAVLLGVSAVVLAQANRPRAEAAPAPAEVAANRDLARSQLDLSRKALDDLKRLAAGGEINFSDCRFSLWGRRRLDALRASGADKAEVVAELEKYRDFMKNQEDFAKKSYNQCQSTRADLWDVQYRRVEAEMWLNTEKAR